jgi:hypothetical protein
MVVVVLLLLLRRRLLPPTHPEQQGAEEAAHTLLQPAHPPAGRRGRRALRLARLLWGEAQDRANHGHQGQALALPFSGGGGLQVAIDGVLQVGQPVVRLLAPRAKLPLAGGG